VVRLFRGIQRQAGGLRQKRVQARRGLGRSERKGHASHAAPYGGNVADAAWRTRQPGRFWRLMATITQTSFTALPMPSLPSTGFRWLTLKALGKSRLASRPVRRLPISLSREKDQAPQRRAAVCTGASHSFFAWLSSTDTVIETPAMSRDVTNEPVKKRVAVIPAPSRIRLALLTIK
jgi:hypothetical protein